MLYYLIIYKKKNGVFVNRIVSDAYFYNIGDTNSYGWIIVDIQVFYEGRFMHLEEFNALIKTHSEKENIKNSITYKKYQSRKRITRKINTCIDKLFKI